MGKINTHLHSFNAGEVSTSALARVDQEKLRLAAEIQENVFPHVIGKGLVRPGSQYLGATLSNNKPRYIPFVKAPDDTALIECTNGAMRVWISDTLLTRPSVTSTVTNGDFSSGTGWTLSATDGGSATISGGYLVFANTGRGATAYCERAVTTSSAGTEHALRIVVTQGPVLFRCGSSSGAEDYITETTLDTGYHSLAFTPSGTYYPRFISRSTRTAYVDSITVESAGVVSLTAPWSLSDLPLIRHAQSIDIIYLACASWQQRKIERRGTGRSWSLAVYQTDDGPFVTTDTRKIKFTLGAAYGVTTLDASSAIFTSSHVGSLVRIVPEARDITLLIAGEEEYTDPMRIFGIGTAKNFSFVMSGTWVGTLSLEYNFSAGDTGFAQNSTYVANATVNSTPGTEYDNVPWYVRVGFAAGNYTSGVASIRVYNGGEGGKAGIVRIIGYTSSTQVNVQVLDAPGSLRATANWQFGAWSDVNGWPSSVCLFDGRLFWGGSDKFWGSESDNYTAFNLVTTGDAGSIQRALATGGTINKVKWMLPLQRLIFGTDGAEISARSSSFDEPLTPTNVTLKDASTQGSYPVSPVKVDGRGIFIHRDGNRSFDLTYEAESNDYTARSLTILHETIGTDGSGFTGLAVQRSPENYIWHVRGDGQCACLIYDQKEKVQGWFRYIAAPSTAGVAVIEDVVVLPSSAGPDRVYLAVKRTINGSTVRYLEKLAKHTEAQGGTGNRMADSYVYNAGPVTTFTGLSHLEGETVVAWGTYAGATGKIGTTYTVSSGQITLPGSCTDVTVGLKYDWRYKTARLAYGAEGGTTLLMPKRVDQIGIIASNFHLDAMRYGSDFTTMYGLPRIASGKATSATTTLTGYDERTFPFGGNWNTDSRVCLSGSAPYPLTLNLLVLGIEANET